MAQKIKTFRGSTPGDLDSQVNCFIRDKSVTNISTTTYRDDHNKVIYQCTVLYSYCNKTLFNF